MVVQQRSSAPRTVATARPALPAGTAKLTHTAFLPLVREGCAAHAPDPAGWHVDEKSSGESLWIMVTPRHAAPPEQGWKLHISATIVDASEVLRRALAVLLGEDAGFKLARSSRVLLALNSGEYALSQVGKFMTVYPNSEAQGVRLAGALHAATAGLRGPAIPSDRPLVPGSLVHYRYGGSAWNYVRDARGELVLAIATPAGEQVPDRRLRHYSPPPWAVDPFLAAGVAHPLPAPPTLVAGRYLVVSTFYRSARGTVQLVVDVPTRRRCILKRAVRDGVMGIDGHDACDRLRQEAYVLDKLAPDPRFPAPYGLHEEGGDLYLAMEDVEGDTLYAYVEGLGQGGRLPAPAQVVAWGRELAALLGAIHDQGLVYKDLKPTNIIVAASGLRLIDFDVTQDAADRVNLYSPGTRGYQSPEQAAEIADRAPCVADDIYSLGALLYYLATGADPSIAPRPRNLTARPVRLLNPTIAPALAEVIARCLERDVALRFSSMRQVGAALAGLAAAAVPAPAFGDQRLDEPPEAAQERYRMQARRLGDTLCRVARRTPEGGLSWVSSHPTANGARTYSINTGSAGALLALAELVAAFGDALQRETLLAGARTLAAVERPQPPLAGLYRGEAGLGAALLRAGLVLDDPALIAAAAASGRRVAGLPYERTDLFQGTAGRLRFHLFLWDATGEQGHLDAAIQAGDALLATAQEAGAGGLRWPGTHAADAPAADPLLGYGHGAAGIADALLDLFEAAGRPGYLAAAQGAARWVVAHAVPALDDGSGLDWPATPGRAPTGPSWCQGATGVGRFFLHLARLDALPGALDVARHAARTAARGARWAGPVPCHGLAGHIEFLLDVFQHTREPAYLREALLLARLLEAFSGELADNLVFASERPSVFSPDYLLGYAGIASCLLRLRDPLHVPHGLSRAGFAKF